jgi:CheY-like chemotaxis protein
LGLCRRNAELHRMRKYHSTILIVDDDPNDLMFIEKAFRAIGVKDPIHTINGGADAIAYMMGECKYADRTAYAYPTFITTDLKMPGTDGLAVLEHLKNNPEWAVVPTVVLTSSRDLDDIKKAYMLGASSYHVKPGSPDELRNRASRRQCPDSAFRVPHSKAAPPSGPMVARS